MRRSGDEAQGPNELLRAPSHAGCSGAWKCPSKSSKSDSGTLVAAAGVSADFARSRRSESESESESEVCGRGCG